MKKSVSIFLVLSFFLTLINFNVAYADDIVTDSSVSKDCLSNLTAEEQKTLESSKKDMLIEIKKKFKVVPIRDFSLSYKTKLILCCASSVTLATSIYIIYKSYKK